MASNAPTSKHRPDPAHVILYELDMSIRLERVRQRGGESCRLELLAVDGLAPFVQPVVIDDPEVARQLGWALYWWSLDPAGRERVA